MNRSTATANDLTKRFAATVVALGLLLGVAAFWAANKAILGLFHDDGIYASAKRLQRGTAIGFSDSRRSNDPEGFTSTDGKHRIFRIPVD